MSELNRDLPIIKVWDNRGKEPEEIEVYADSWEANCAKYAREGFSMKPIPRGPGKSKRTGLEQAIAEGRGPRMLNIDGETPTIPPVPEDPAPETPKRRGRPPKE